MKIQIEVSEKELRDLVLAKIRLDLGEAGAKLDESDVRIEVKSKQNYRSEWEAADFRARVDVNR